MKRIAVLAAVSALAILVAGASHAAVTTDLNWATSVYDYSANIQNYSGELMTSSTEWWLIGSSDADTDGNGYAWDVGDFDYVAGWRSSAPDEYIIMEWETGISDIEGDDLSICMYCGPSASADVYASVDGSTYIQIGTIGSGTPGYLQDLTFDLSGEFEDDVYYVKVVRTSSGSQTGMFFDSFAGITTSVPEPGLLAMLGSGILGLALRRYRK